MQRIKPIVIALVFWIATFIFIAGSYSGSFGFLGISGFAVSDGENPSSAGQGAAILLLFFSNIVTLFFLIRQMLKK